MKFKTKKLKVIRSARTKSITTHNRNPTVSTHYDGNIFLDNKEIKICDVPIRASTYYKNNILLGNDRGEITVHDVTGTKIQTIKAHTDFIRDLDSNSEIFVSCSDDFTLKVFKDYKPIAVMNHDHFVMAVRISDRIYSCSLDCTIKIWDLESFQCVGTLKGHLQGVNTLCIFKDYIVSGSDDHKVNVYDLNTYKLLHSLDYHTNNVLGLFYSNNYLYSGSEDGVVNVFNTKTFNLVATFRPNLGRVWCINQKDNLLYIGCDEGIQTLELKKEKILSVYFKNKIIFILDNTVYRITKSDDEVTLKELKILDFEPKNLQTNSKLLAIENEDKTEIYNILGFRSKESVNGVNLFFDNDEYVYKKDNEIFIKNKIMKIADIQELFYLKDSLFAGITTENTIIFNSDRILTELPKYRKVLYFKDFIIGFGDSIDLFTDDFKFHSSYKHKVDDFWVFNGVIFFKESNNFYYMLLETKIFIQFLKIEKNFILGFFEDVCISLKSDFQKEIIHIKDLILYSLDIDFIEYQKKILNNEFISKPLNKKMIVFLESLGYYELILENITDSNMKFEIYIKMKKYDEALKLCKTSNQFYCLGKLFLKEKEYKKASFSFYKSGNFDDAFLVSMAGGNNFNNLKSELKSEITEMDKNDVAKIDKVLRIELREKVSGLLKFILNYKNQEYDKCAEYLKDTEFYDIFLRNHEI